MLTSLALRPLLALALTCASLAASPSGRVVVLGFDGADSTTTQRLMDAGQLPNLAHLRDQGTFAPLGTTTPAESPVSWAALNSGQNPAKTGVSGFVARKFDPKHEPHAQTGFFDLRNRQTADLQLPAWQHFLVARTPLEVAWISGGVAALVFLLVFLLILRLGRWLSIGLAILLGGAGGWAGWSASRALPRTIENVCVNVTHTGGFWEVAARAGVKSIVLDGAMAWDRPEVQNSQVLAGLGLPDARGDYGSWCLYTTQDDDQAFSRAPQWRDTGSGGRVFRVDERDGRIDSFLYGPYDHLRIDRLVTRVRELEHDLAQGGRPVARERELEQQKRDLELQLEDIRKTQRTNSVENSDDYRLSVPLTVTRPSPDKVEITIGAEKQTLGEGEWSAKWFHPRFDGSPLFQTQTVTRVKVRKLHEPFELLVDFLNLDPAHPAFYQPASQPPAFAGELARAIDTSYETVGWACLTHGFKDGEIDARSFLEDIEFTHEWRRKLLLAALDRKDWRLLMDVESTPDRVQHMCYQFSDPTHPLYKKEDAAQKIRLFGEDIAFSQAIDASYRSMDRLVGEVLAKLAPDDVLLVCSDHGFQSFRRQCQLNNWLAASGYLALKPDLTLSDKYFPDYIDWSKTQAYALGLGMIFVNQRGREAQGIVSSQDTPALLERLSKDLLALEDDGHKAIHSVKLLSRIHSGPYLADEADLMVGFEAGWRVSWSTTEGNIRLQGGDQAPVIPGPVFTDNTSNWSGDHVSVAEELVRGIFFSNRKLRLPAEGVDLLHVAPTALSLLDVKAPAEYDRAPLELLH